MDQAAVFLAGSILTGLGFIAIIASVVVVNNIVAKYWKPLGWFKSWAPLFDHEPKRFAEPHEVAEPTEPKLDLSKNK